MSETENEIPPAPEPTVDENPDLGNEAGGPDAVEDRVHVPPLSAELPQPAQLDDADIPDAIQELEEPDSEANHDDPSAEPSG